MPRQPQKAVPARSEQALTDRKVAALTTKPGTYADGKGLSLCVLDTGTASWRYRYRLAGKPGIAVLGNYPDMSLSKARAALEDARADVAAGVKPAQRQWTAKQKATAVAREATNTLGAVADKWFAMAVQEGAWADSTADKTRGRLDLHIKTSALWHMPIAQIEVVHLAPLLDKLHSKQPDTANKVRQILSGIFRWAAARGLVKFNPVPDTRPGSGMRKRSHLKGTRRLAAVTDLAALGNILRAVEQAQASWQVRGALHLCAYTAQRPGRVVAARWDELDLESKAPTWTIPRELQKVKDDERGDHVVPLAPAVVAWLNTLPSKDEEFVFATPSGHVTLEAPSKLLRVTLGLANLHTPHGWRSSFSSLANNENNEDGSRRFDRHDIEQVLDHDTRNDSAATYDRLRALPRLRAILEWWADSLDAARARK